MNITLEKIPDRRGCKLIMVDGVQWGKIYMEGHGCHGPSYWFEQTGDGGAISDENGRAIDIYSNERVARRRGQDISEPIEKRLMDAVVGFIEQGKLRHPDKVKADQEAAHARWKEAERLGKIKDRERDVAKGREIVNRHFKLEGETYIDASLKAKIAEEIADAIERGRSQ